MAAGQPNPIHPRVKDAKAYERRIRRVVVTPLFRQLRTGLADAASITQVYRAMDAAVEAVSVRGIPIREIRKSLAQIDSYHRDRLIKSFRAALGVNVSPFLTRSGIDVILNARIADNVSLIKTIAPRFHTSMTAALQREFAEAPFDAQRLSALVRQEYKSTGYNLRRIVRDQNNKLIGQLTRERQQQMGVQGYQWQTVGDERVRQSHVENGGKFFRWDDPPATGHPGEEIQCRCVAIAALLKRDRDRLKQGGRQPPGPAPTPAPPTPAPPVPPAPAPAPPLPPPPPPAPTPPPLSLFRPNAAAPVEREVRSLQLGPAAERSRRKIENMQAGNLGQPPVPLTDEKIHELLTDAFGTDRYMSLLGTALGEQKTAVHMAIRRADLTKAVRDNKFKSSIETGKGSFKTIGEDRFKIEKNVFGMADDAIENVDQFPKYGFLSGAKRMDYADIVTKNYGENFVRFKPDVRKRSTFTLGDSLDGNAYSRRAPATPLNDQQTASLLGVIEANPGGTYYVRDFNKKYLRQFAKNGNLDDLAKGNFAPYLEAQVFGRTTLDDVAAIAVESKKYAKTLRRSLDRAGYSHVEIQKGRFHVRLQEMWEGNLSAFDSLSPVDIDNLGAAYLDKIISHHAGSLLTKRRPGGSLGWLDSQLPDEINAFRLQTKNAQDALKHWTVEHKREFLKTVYRLKAEGEAGGLPKPFWKDFRKTKAGFTEDVYNEDLLRAYAKD